MNRLSYSTVLQQYPETAGDCRRDIRQLLNRQRIKLVVMDDDPTGIQTVHSCRLVTDWQADSLGAALADEAPFFYVLTNTRAMTRDEAARVTASAMQAVLEANRKQGFRLVFISRSDSTLRGHFPLETDLMAQGLRHNGQALCPVTFFAPAFLEAGRYTLLGCHYLKDGDTLIPVSESEFARDNVFAYHSAVLKDYIAEKLGTDDFFYRNLPLTEFPGLTPAQRLQTLGSLMDLARAESRPAYISVDALRCSDLQAFALTLLEWMGSHDEAVVIRSSSSLPKAMSGSDDRPLLDRQDFVGEGAATAPGLFIVGSHVKKSTAQLNALLKCQGTVGIELDIRSILDHPQELSDEVQARLKDLAAQGLCPVVYTSRQEVRLDNADERQRLGQQVSDFLVSIVSHLSYRPSWLVAKGGITSHDILTKGLCVRTAQVMGQILSGVPCLRTAQDAAIPRLPYVIFPGNVGEESSLAQVFEKLR